MTPTFTTVNIFNRVLFGFYEKTGYFFLLFKRKDHPVGGITFRAIVGKSRFF